MWIRYLPNLSGLFGLPFIKTGFHEPELVEKVKTLGKAGRLSIARNPVKNYLNLVCNQSRQMVFINEYQNLKWPVIKMKSSLDCNAKCTHTGCWIHTAVAKASFAGHNIIEKYLHQYGLYLTGSSIYTFTSEYPRRYYSTSQPTKQNNRY